MQLFGLELFPVLAIALVNGWILLICFYLIELVLVLSFPKGTRKRLFEYDHSKWSKRHRIALVLGKTLALVMLILIFFSPLKIGTPVFLSRNDFLHYWANWFYHCSHQLSKHTIGSASNQWILQVFTQPPSTHTDPYHAWKQSSGWFCVCPHHPHRFLHSYTCSHTGRRESLPYTIWHFLSRIHGTGTPLSHHSN
jgi:hypothetical protein